VNRHFRPAFTFAHLARCAAAMLARLFADIFRRLRLGLPPLINASERPKRSVQTRQLLLYAVTFLFQLPYD
jgi:hypothetical protein